MKRLLALLAGVLGLRALLRRSRRPLAPSPADDLRARLAESKAAADDRDEFEAGETPIDQVPDVDTRRADAHAKARQAIDELS